MGLGERVGLDKPKKDCLFLGLVEQMGILG
jgi:hypothetical protein